MGLEEEILPPRSSIEAATIEEDRRLAYVGLTRARQTLAFTFAAHRRPSGELSSSRPPPAPPPPPFSHQTPLVSHQHPHSPPTPPPRGVIIPTTPPSPPRFSFNREGHHVCVSLTHEYCGVVLCGG